MAPHLVWLVQNDFLPFSYAEARAAPARGLLDHLWHPLQFALSQLGFVVPALLIAAPLVWPRRAGAPVPAASADGFDRRIVALLAFGPLATVLALSAITGRGTVAMWGYPLFLFVGVWMVLRAPRPFDAGAAARDATLWALVSIGYAVAFVANYAVLPRFDGRYRAVLYPGDRLAAELTRRYEAATGGPPVYVIGSMWDGGNAAHYSPAQPRVLIDGNPRRAPWIDLTDLRRRGALVVWTDSPGDAIPEAFRAVAGNAEVQPSFRLPPRLGNANHVDVGWAILRPQDSAPQR